MAEILVLPSAACGPLPAAGTWPISSWPSGANWLERDLAEHDERWLQPIPYVLLTRDGEVWCYRRRGGDPRLDGGLSCGVGGHVERDDWRNGLEDAVLAAARRELSEELENAAGLSPPVPRAWLYEGASAVGRVHVGIVCTVRWPGGPPRVRDGEALDPLGFRPARAVARDRRFERWSRLAASLLVEAP